MKKISLYIVAAFFATIIVSCQSGLRDSSATDSVEIAVSIPVAKEQAIVQTDVPKFSNQEVNKELSVFTSLKDQYVVALKNKNTAEIQSLSDKYAVWSQNAATWTTKLKADETQKYIDYMAKISKEWIAATLQPVK